MYLGVIIVFADFKFGELNGTPRFSKSHRNLLNSVYITIINYGTLMLAI